MRRKIQVKAGYNINRIYPPLTISKPDPDLRRGYRLCSLRSPSCRMRLLVMAMPPQRLGDWPWKIDHLQVAEMVLRLALKIDGYMSGKNFKQSLSQRI